MLNSPGMNVWVFRRGSWEPRAMPSSRPPRGLGLGTTPQMLTPDGSVNLYVGLNGAEFLYGVSLRLGDTEAGHQEWICVPDLPSLLEIMQLLGPWLRNEVAIQSFLTSMVDQHIGPPPDGPVGSGSVRDLTAMNQVVVTDTSVSADLDRLVERVEANAAATAPSIDEVIRDLTNMRAQITNDGDPNGMRFDAVITLLQSASLLLQSGEDQSAIAEVKKAAAAWKMDETEQLLP